MPKDEVEIHPDAHPNAWGVGGHKEYADEGDWPDRVSKNGCFYINREYKKFIKIKQDWWEKNQRWLFAYSCRKY